MGNKSLMAILAKYYDPKGNFLDGMVSPLYGDCRGLPPIQLQVGSDEVLRDDSVRFHEKFKEETPVELILCEDTPHCHQIFGFLPEAAIARRKRQEFIAAQT